MPQRRLDAFCGKRASLNEALGAELRVLRLYSAL